MEILDKSIAVLPFVDMSAGKDHEYFSDGLSEELLNLLSKIPELKVIGRTSSFSFKDKNKDLRTIGEKLGVATILEGSVRKEGNKIRVNAQLIKAADGSQLWSERYERDLEGIFKLQDEIAGAVVKQLQLKLLAVQKSPVHPEAYEAYLKGRFLAYKLSSKSLETAMQYFQSALQKEPDYALAYTGMGIVWWIQGNMKLTLFHEAHLQAKSAALKAINLDEQLAEGHELLARILVWYEWDWPAAEKEYLRAIETIPTIRMHAHTIRYC